MSIHSSHKPTNLYEEITSAVDSCATVRNHKGHRVGSLFLDKSNIEDLRSGFMLEQDPESKTEFVEASESKLGGSEMSTQDRYIDDRLSTIENGLDRRMADMQRFQERSEDRFERQVSQSEQRNHDLIEKYEEKTRKDFEKLDNHIQTLHADNKVTRTTIIATSITTAIAVIGLVATIVIGQMSAFQTTVSEQGAWMRQSIEQPAQTQSEIQESEPNTGSQQTPSSTAE